MGYRFYKRINLGLGFRINISKSGVGYSWGGPGYRVTHTVNGRVRKTYSIPRTGLSYVEENKKENHPIEVYYDENTKLITGSTTHYENKDLSLINQKDKIINKIKILRFLDVISTIMLIGTIFSYIYLIIGIIIKGLLLTFLKVKLTYEFDEFSIKRFNSYNFIMEELNKNNKIWQVHSSTDVYNTKYNAGAEHIISRTVSCIKFRMPYYIKTNIKIYGIKLKNETIYFTPDRIIIFSGVNKVVAKKYGDLDMDFSTTRFVENNIVPFDSRIVDYTWQYVNKNGGPDRRFNNNRKYPICLYGEVKIKSSDGINILLQYSNSNLTSSIMEKFRKFIKYQKNTNEEIKEFI